MKDSIEYTKSFESEDEALYEKVFAEKLRKAEKEEQLNSMRSFEDFVNDVNKRYND